MSSTTGPTQRGSATASTPAPSISTRAPPRARARPESARRDRRRRAVGAQRLGNRDRALRVLAILEQRDQGAADRDRGPVEGVEVDGRGALGGPEATAEPAGLKVGRVRA